MGRATPRTAPAAGAPTPAALREVLPAIALALPSLIEAAPRLEELARRYATACRDEQLLGARWEAAGKPLRGRAFEAVRAAADVTIRARRDLSDAVAHILARDLLPCTCKPMVQDVGPPSMHAPWCPQVCGEDTGSGGCMGTRGHKGACAPPFRLARQCAGQEGAALIRRLAPWATEKQIREWQGVDAPRAPRRKRGSHA
jgi:hypothetical protein